MIVALVLLVVAVFVLYMVWKFAEIPPLKTGAYFLMWVCCVILGVLFLFWVLRVAGVYHGGLGG